jgi:lipopolysaccharide/colanic/teichoic acid biosynthesis glycosyltransferase
MKQKFKSKKIYKNIKRFFDLWASILGVLFLSPLFLFILLLLRFTGEGETFYLQERVGYKNRLFSIYKFATMLKNSANIGGKSITVRNDPRITKFGKILRISKLNELPQILNVVIGDMSLVGPRPLLVKSVSKYDTEVQSCIYKNRPGITGIGSLVFRDEEKLVTAYKNLGYDPFEYYQNHIYPYKGKLEIWYYKNQSFSIDFKILFLTFWSLVNSNSELVFKSFKDLPARPKSITLDGIKDL